MMTDRVRWGLAALIVVLVTLSPAAGGAQQRPTMREGDGPTPTPARVTVSRVRVINFAFKPRSITINRGTKVRWVVRQGTHSTTSNTGLWDSGVLSAGGSFARVFRKAGTFKYHCQVHPTLMKGVITVK